MGTGDQIRSLLDEVESAPGVTLSPVERLLLATDGTVTHMLEALTRGPVTVDIISRDVHDEMLFRQVVLRREADDAPLVWAASAVYLGPLPGQMADELVDGDMGIGDLLRDHYTETRREIDAMSVTRPDGGGFPTFIDPAVSVYLQRSYTVYSDGDSLMEITEYFPKGVF